MGELMEMDSRSLSERMVYDARIRISDLDILAARISCTLVAVNTPKGHRRPKIEDFLPQRQAARRGISTPRPSAELAAIFEAMYADKPAAPRAIPGPRT